MKTAGKDDAFYEKYKCTLKEAIKTLRNCWEENHKKRGIKE